MIELGKRIMIIGSSGSGKNTISKELGQITNLPVIHLDKYFWNKGWVATPKDEWIKKQQKLLSGDEWIIDGHYGKTMDLRLEKAEVVIFLDVNRYICIYRVLKRWLTHLGATREDMGVSCHEKIDWDFLNWIWKFPVNERQSLLKKLELYNGEIIILKNSKEARSFIMRLNCRR